jgi:CheY-like chemotaxis protein
VHADGLVQALERAVTGPAREIEVAAQPVPCLAVLRPDVDARLPFTGRRVLLAEDQPVNQRLALRILGKLGCTVDLADNGIDACALAAATDYDLILMDCHMPEMDGYEATVAIRAREAVDRAEGPSSRQAPIVALTASVLKEDRDRCFACGMDDFISKPFRPDQLRAALERWANRGGEAGEPLREAA